MELQQQVFSKQLTQLQEAAASSSKAKKEAEEQLAALRMEMPRAKLLDQTAFWNANDRDSKMSREVMSREG